MHMQFNMSNRMTDDDMRKWLPNVALTLSICQSSVTIALSDMSIWTIQETVRKKWASLVSVLAVEHDCCNIVQIPNTQTLEDTSSSTETKQTGQPGICLYNPIIRYDFSAIFQTRWTHKENFNFFLESLLITNCLNSCSFSAFKL